MEPNENFEDGFENSLGTVVIAFRDSPTLKEELDNERIERGENYSSYLRGIVRDRHKSKEKVEQLTLRVAEQQKEIENLRAQVAATGGKQFELMQAENNELKKQIETLKNQSVVYSDKRLLYLYEGMKGKKDKVLNAYGDDFAVVYDTPYQVLLALIYSCKLKQ